MTETGERIVVWFDKHEWERLKRGVSALCHQGVPTKGEVVRVWLELPNEEESEDGD